MIKKKLFIILTVAILMNSSLYNGVQSAILNNIIEENTDLNLNKGLFENPNILLNKPIENINESFDLQNKSSIKLQTRSKNDIRNMYLKLKTSANNENFNGTKFSELPNLFVPYKSGKLTKEFMQDGLNAVNLFRYIAGLPSDISLDTNYNDKAQHGAAVLGVLNKLTHYPTKPSDMNQAFFDKGYSGTSSSNIAFSKGYNGNFSLGKTIRLYMDDSDSKNITNLGHRLWLLSPNMQKTGFGYTMNTNGSEFSSTYILDNSRKTPIDYDFISWPSKNVHPYEYFKSHEAWSVSLNSNKFSNLDPNKIKIRVKRLNDNKVWNLDNTIPQNNKNSKFAPYFNVNTGSYGLKNTIIFRPGDITRYKDGDKFEITITGLTDKSGKSTSIKYTTEFFSVKSPLEETLPPTETLSPLDIAYKNAYNATMAIRDVPLSATKFERQELINKARSAIAKLKEFPNQVSNIRTFSSIVDKPQHNILVDIVNSIKTCENFLNQKNINIARNNIPTNLPNKAHWLSSYSSKVDSLQLSFLKKVEESVILAEEVKSVKSINIAKNLASELTTSVSKNISKMGEDLLKRVNKITALN